MITFVLSLIAVGFRMRWLGRWLGYWDLMTGGTSGQRFLDRLWLAAYRHDRAVNR